MRAFIQKRPFLFSCCYNLILLIGFFSLFYTRFGTTDDVEMQMVLAGKAVLQEPSAYLRWTHIFIGQLLSSLYASLPNQPWYGYYLATAHFLGLTAILYSILKLKTSLFRVAFYTLCFVLGASAFLQELQFTSSAIVLGIGGAFMVFTAINSTNQGHQRVAYISSFLLLILVAMIRWDSFQLIVVLATPLLLYVIFQQSEKYWFNILFCSSILVAAWAVDQTHYLIQNQDPEWEKFNRYKHSLAAHDILDYKKPQYNWTASNADDYFYKVGWEYEDLMLFKDWFFADSTIYGLKQFKAIQASFQHCPYPEEHLMSRIWRFSAEQPIQDYVFYCFIILCFSLLFFKGNRWLYLTLITSGLMIWGILLSLFLFKHLPARVSYPMAFYLIALAMLFVTYDKEIHRKNKLVALGFLLVIAVSNIKMVVKNSSKTAFQKMYFTEALDSLNAQPGQLYVGGGDYYMEALMTPFQNSNDSIFDHFNMLDFGHLSNCPTYYKQLENFGIEDIHKRVVVDSNIYLIHRYGDSFISWYASYLRRHHGLYVNMELVRKEENVNVAIYKVVEQIRDEPNSQGISLANMHEFGLELKDPDAIEIDTTKPQADYLEEESFIIAH